MPAKLLAGARIKFQVGVACAALLMVGVWIAPPRVAPILPSEERAAPLLEEQVQRAAERPFRGVEDIAERIVVAGVSIRTPQPPRVANDFSPPRPPAPAAFGVPLGNGFVLTHRFALHGRRDVQIDTPDAVVEGSVAAYDEATGLVLLRTSPPLSAAAAVATTLPASGTLAVGAARWPGHTLVLPVFIAMTAGDRLRIGGAGSAAEPGLPIFDAEARLIAISFGDTHARPVQPAIDRLLANVMGGLRPHALGISFQDVTLDLQPVFGAGGALVLDVLPAGPAAQAGIRPGDVITAVGDTRVTDSGSLRRALASAAGKSAFTLRRFGTPVIIEADAIDAFDAASLADRRRPVEVSWRASDIVEQPQRDALGISDEARILSIDGRVPASAESARRELARNRTAALLVEDGGQRTFILIGRQR